MTAIFDTYLIIDWSAANAPKRGRDSIWIGEARRDGGKIRQRKPVNPATRAEAMAIIERRIALCLLNERRVFLGFDFPFGYPAGAAMALTNASLWDALWKTLAEHIEDGEDNCSNRYELANAWNRTRFRTRLYWGRPHQHIYANLDAKKPTGKRFKALEFRIVERWQKPAKSVWQLAYNGAVGSQAMLGMARLEALRNALGTDGAVWPYETEWDARLEAPVAIAEVYPSMFPVKPRKGEVKDAAQVRTVARHFARLDAKGKFRPLLARPPELDDADNAKVLAEEGWIVGAGRPIERA